ncbi:hypothetical protein PENTCL1PPCAC_13905, partial [Pristionchus entomophagus]
QMVPPRITIPSKDFSHSDPNRGLGIRCVVMMISARDEEEALRFIAKHPDKLAKYPLRLPSDARKFPALEQFLRSEEGLQWDVGVQATVEEQSQEDQWLDALDTSVPGPEADDVPEAKVKEEDEDDIVEVAKAHNRRDASPNEDDERPRIRLSMKEEEMSDIDSEYWNEEKMEEGNQSDESVAYIPPKKKRKSAKK